MWRPHIVVLDGGCGGGGSTPAPLAALTIQCFFVGFNAAFCEAARLPLFSVLRDFCKVAASRCCFLSARAAASSISLCLALLLMPHLCNSPQRLCLLCHLFLYSIVTALNSLALLFWSFSSSSLRRLTVLRTRTSQILQGLHSTVLPWYFLCCCRLRTLLFFLCFCLVVNTVQKPLFLWWRSLFRTCRECNAAATHLPSAFALSVTAASKKNC
jgi:hypothetical protein